jgi:rhodanese-related sulfurtransferase
MAVEEISVTALYDQNQADRLVFDVREPDEYSAEHMPGAVLIPLGQVMERLDEFPLDKPFAVICRSGGRSMQAARYLDAQGRTCVNVAGGTMAWVEAGFAVISGTEPM